MGLKNPFLSGGQWSNWAYVYASIVSLQVLALICIQILCLSKASKKLAMIEDSNTNGYLATKITYNINGWILIVMSLLEAGFVFIKLKMKNEILGFFTLVLDFSLGVQSIIQLCYVMKPILKTGTLVISHTLLLVMLLVLFPVKTYIFLKLKSNFGWLVYRALGPNLTMRKSYYKQQLLVGSLFLNSVYIFNFWLPFTTWGSSSVIPLLFALGLVLLLISLIYFSVYQEMKWLYNICFVVHVILVAVLLCMLVFAGKRNSSSGYNKKIHLYFGVMTLLLHILVSVSLFLARSTLGVGLRNQLNEIHILMRTQIDLEEINDTSRMTKMPATRHGIQSLTKMLDDLALQQRKSLDNHNKTKTSFEENEKDQKLNDFSSSISTDIDYKLEYNNALDLKKDALVSPTNKSTDLFESFYSYNPSKLLRSGSSNSSLDLSTIPKMSSFQQPIPDTKKHLITDPKNINSNSKHSSMDVTSSPHSHNNSLNSDNTGLKVPAKALLIDKKTDYRYSVRAMGRDLKTPLQGLDTLANTAQKLCDIIDHNSEESVIPEKSKAFYLENNKPFEENSLVDDRKLFTKTKSISLPGIHNVGIRSGYSKEVDTPILPQIRNNIWEDEILKNAKSLTLTDFDNMNSKTLFENYACLLNRVAKLEKNERQLKIELNKSKEYAKYLQNMTKNGHNSYDNNNTLHFYEDQLESPGYFNNIKNKKIRSQVNISYNNPNYNGEEILKEHSNNGVRRNTYPGKIDISDKTVYSENLSDISNNIDEQGENPVILQVPPTSSRRSTLFKILDNEETTLKSIQNSNQKTRKNINSTRKKFINYDSNYFKCQDQAHKESYLGNIKSDQLQMVDKNSFRQHKTKSNSISELCSYTPETYGRPISYTNQNSIGNEKVKSLDKLPNSNYMLLPKINEMGLDAQEQYHGSPVYAEDGGKFVHLYPNINMDINFDTQKSILARKGSKYDTKNSVYSSGYSLVPAPTTREKVLGSNEVLSGGKKRKRQAELSSRVRSVQPVPRDPDGKYILPIQVGILTLLDLGTIVYDRDSFHSERYIWPVGYLVQREYLSMNEPNKLVIYTCRISDGGDGPRFHIEPEDMPNNPIIAHTATGAWTTVVKRVNSINNKNHSNSASGPDYFGFSHPTIAKMIQDLPNSDKCKNYVLQKFVEMKERHVRGVIKKGRGGKPNANMLRRGQRALLTALCSSLGVGSRGHVELCYHQ
ncbi:hypothetical protein BB558_003691 [Smittium angustum]|uniref:FYR N-terminal domain-containing protein n=1 Tax=Smittium angustum TaxID=133377 RepID=A0A2U1J5D0_SMIAN|nr:hypothetical protein BB558_003691 [Smittium angustum]